MLFFDDLNKEDHEGCVCRIAMFIGIKWDDDIIARVVHTTTHAEIATHLSKFGVHRFATAQLLLLRSLEKALHLKVNPFNSRVRRDGGRSGDGKEQLPDEVQQHIDSDVEGDCDS